MNHQWISHCWYEMRRSTALSTRYPQPTFLFGGKAPSSIRVSRIEWTATWELCHLATSTPWQHASLQPTTHTNTVKTKGVEIFGYTRTSKGLPSYNPSDKNHSLGRIQCNNLFHWHTLSASFTASVQLPVLGIGYDAAVRYLTMLTFGEII
jgi:hypothetical protein